jgi:hypothetical protein
MSQGLCPSCGAAVTLTAGQTDTKCQFCDGVVTLQQPKAPANELNKSDIGDEKLATIDKYLAKHWPNKICDYEFGRSYMARQLAEYFGVPPYVIADRMDAAGIRDPDKREEAAIMAEREPEVAALLAEIEREEAATSAERERERETAKTRAEREPEERAAEVAAKIKVLLEKSERDTKAAQWGALGVVCALVVLLSLLARLLARN